MASFRTAAGVVGLINLLCSLAVIAAPPVHGSARADRQSAASRLVTGEAAHLQAVVDGGVAGGGVAGGSYYIRMEPVQPLDGSSYGGNCSIAGNTITCLHGPQRLWFDIYIGGWAPDSLKVYQLGMSYTSFTSGAGGPLVLPGVPCTTNPECESVFGSGSQCKNAGNTECQFAWEDASRPNYHGFTLAAVSIFDPIRWGATGLSQLVADPGVDVYAGSLAVDAQAGSFGTYTLDFLADGNTFFTLADGTSPHLDLFTFTPAVVELPFGRCCVFPGETCADDVTLEECNGLGGLFVQDGLDCTTPCDPADFRGQCCLKDACVDELTQAECVAGDGYIEFHANQDCTTVCPQCQVPYSYEDPHCDDGDACTTDYCNADLVCEHKLGFNESVFCCDGNTGHDSHLDDGNPCTTDACDGLGPIGARDPSTAGTAVHTPVTAGTPCAVDDICTIATCSEDVACEVVGLTFDAATECCNGTTGTVTQLDDGKVCTVDSCDGYGHIGDRDPATAGRAIHPREPTGTPCDNGDGDLCTGACNDSGFCAGSMVNFDPATECCNGDTGDVTQLDDGDSCTLDTCDETGAVGYRDPSTAGTAIHEPLPPAPGDLDNSCAVDLVDYGLLLGCFKGPNTGNFTLVCPPDLRAAADLDDDNDVDLQDAADLFTLLTSP